MQIDGRVALVTGAASGLGRATAVRLASAGAVVVLVDRPGVDTAAVRRDAGADATAVPADVTREEDVRAAVAAAAERGGPHIVVHCAGIGGAARVLGPDGPLPLADFRRVVEVNLIGTFNVVRLAAAQMAAHDTDAEERGVIVTTASVAAFDGQIGQAAYAASKGGVAALTLPLARDLASLRIRVCAIAPGIFDTPMLHGLRADVRASLAAQVPHPRRLGRPEEYADLVCHVIGNPMLNGTVIRLDGALRMGPR